MLAAATTRRSRFNGVAALVALEAALASSGYEQHAWPRRAAGIQFQLNACRRRLDASVRSSWLAVYCVAPSARWRLSSVNSGLKCPVAFRNFKSSLISFKISF